ncbi:hypothetical protein DL96DRAFT_1716226 [Flagelloscypha sp. PMI_526]|nr:hypothetical protein DL96DRAFT_1716226 [Flagelloscypha sp. PMI_526]
MTTKLFLVFLLATLTLVNSIPIIGDQQIEQRAEAGVDSTNVVLDPCSCRILGRCACNPFKHGPVVVEQLSSLIPSD